VETDLQSIEDIIRALLNKLEKGQITERTDFS